MSTAVGTNPISVPMSTARRASQTWLLGIVVLADVALALLSIFVSVQLCRRSSSDWATLASNLLPIPITIALLALWGCYRSLPINWRVECPTLLAGTSLGFALGELIAGFVAVNHGPAMVFGVAWGLALLFFVLARMIRQLTVGDNTSVNDVPVVIFGTPASVHNVFRALTKTNNGRLQNSGFKIEAIFADGTDAWADIKRENVVVNETAWLKNFTECCGVRHGIVAVPYECDRETEELFSKSAHLFKHLLVAPQIVKGSTSLCVEQSPQRALSLLVGKTAVQNRQGFAKRLCDILGSSILSILSLPFMLLVALAIRLTSKGPILFKQIRIGKGNRAFTALKFRTMYSNADQRLHDYLEKEPTLREEWESVQKLKHDPRVTPIGRFLRRFSLDELPQIWNVLLGDMSLVGPRPIVLNEIEKYGSDYAAYERVRPGLTGLWQVSGRNDTTYQQRVDFDAHYVKNWSLWFDVKILLRTFRAVISGVGAY
jgi:Undecaprenyl-phosphate galactose phosphotransferase WbaP